MWKLPRRGATAQRGGSPCGQTHRPDPNQEKREKGRKGKSKGMPKEAHAMDHCQGLVPVSSFRPRHDPGTPQIHLRQTEARLRYTPGTSQAQPAHQCPGAIQAHREKWGREGGGVAIHGAGAPRAQECDVIRLLEEVHAPDGHHHLLGLVADEDGVGGALKWSLGVPHLRSKETGAGIEQEQG